MAKKTALLILDMLNTFEFPEAEQLLPHAQKAAKNILKLKRRCQKKKIPILYINDNFGHWRSDWHQVYDIVTQPGCLGAEIAQLLKPELSDFFVTKPMHSGFFGTTLDVLLENLKIESLILTGIAGNICVLFTANDAHMRGYKVITPSDCMASNTPKDNQYALHQFKKVFNFRTAAQNRLKL